MTDTASLLNTLLAFVWAPVFVVAGIIDWALHRHLRIEETAGLHESLLHLLMVSELGAAIIAALFLEPTAGLLGLLLIVVALHELTYLFDLRVALAHRPIPIFEQWVHGFQHLLPWAGLAGLMALSPDQTAALVGLSSHVPVWAIRLKADPPTHYAVLFISAGLICNAMPFVEEAWRGAKARRAHSHSS